jgi:hypothetical protein
MVTTLDRGLLFGLLFLLFRFQSLFYSPLTLLITLELLNVFDAVDN